MLECIVRYLSDKYQFSRVKSTVIAASGSAVLGLGAAMSFNVLADFTPLSFIDSLAGKTLFDLMDYSVANIMIPLNALLIVLFCAWVMKASTVKQEFSTKQSVFYKPWLMIIKFVAPIGILAVLIIGI